MSSTDPSASYPNSPRRVVVAYIRALDRHNGAAVCRLFAPALRTYESLWDGSGLRRLSCARTVAAHFSSYYSRHEWASARVVGAMHVTIEPRTGIAAVRMTLIHRYICAPQRDFPAEPCRPNSYVTAEIVYLTRSDRRWMVIKPGLVYRASEIDSPLDSESYFYPPGTPRTLAGPVHLSSPPPVCPPGGVDIRFPSHSLQSTFEPNPRGRPGSVPGLEIRGLRVARAGPATICFALTLAGPPKPDDGYSISVGTVAQQAAADTYDVEFDGLGNAHALIAGLGLLAMPSLRRALPTVFLSGNQLEIVGTDRHYFRRSSFIVGATTDSIQDDEPLIRKPLDAGDDVPLGGCLVFPSGKLLRKGLCGSSGGP